MSDYIRSNEGPGNIGALNPTIGYPQQQPAMPQYNPYPVPPSMPQYPAQPAMQAYPRKSGGLRGLLGLGTDGTTPFWQRAWFPYAALGALGLFVLYCRSSSVGRAEFVRNGTPQPGRMLPRRSRGEMENLAITLRDLMVKSAKKNNQDPKRIYMEEVHNLKEPYGVDGWILGARRLRDDDGAISSITMAQKEEWPIVGLVGPYGDEIGGKLLLERARDFFDPVEVLLPPPGWGHRRA